MVESNKVENLILGGGEAGKYVAWELAREGRRTVVVERGLIGGSCPNIACLPTKNIIRSAKVADLFRHAADYGQRTGPITTDIEGVRRRKRAMVEGMIEIHRARFAANGLEFILGEGRFVAARTVEVRLAEGGTRRLEAERIFLNLGTHAAIPDVPGLAAAQPLTPVEALELDHLPEHLIVLGGGYVGVELAQAFRRFGSRVSVIEYGPQLMGREDPDVADAVHALFDDDGIEVIPGADTQAVQGRSGDWVQIRLRTSTTERVIDGSDVLVAAGRAPNTKGIGLDVAGVELDEKGYIKVNDRLQTKAAAVWAMGECAGSPQFTHAAFDDFRVVRDNLAGGNRTTQARSAEGNSVEAELRSACCASCSGAARPGQGREIIEDYARGVNQLARHFGVLLGNASERIVTEAASAEVSEVLATAEGALVVVLDRVILALDGRPVEWRAGWCNLAGKCYQAMIG